VKRLEKARSFVDYLGKEEAKEIDAFGLDPSEAFVPHMVQTLADDTPRVLKSAKRNA
jgi:hypothetical protein